MSTEPEAPQFDPPRIPTSAAALLFDATGALLVLKPTYKSGWTIPGGQMEATGETPWEGCQREVLEETALEVEAGALVCVDFLRPRGDRPGGLRFLFDCGVLTEAQCASIKVQAGEIAEHRFADIASVEELLSGPLRRRVRAALASSSCVYLEDGHPSPGVVVRGAAQPTAEGR